MALRRAPARRLFEGVAEVIAALRARRGGDRGDLRHRQRLLDAEARPRPRRGDDRAGARPACRSPSTPPRWSRRPWSAPAAPTRPRSPSWSRACCPPPAPASADAADALAVAIAHAHARRGAAAWEPRHDRAAARAGRRGRRGGGADRRRRRRLRGPLRRRARSSRLPPLGDETLLHVETQWSEQTGLRLYGFLDPRRAPRLRRAAGDPGRRAEGGAGRARRADARPSCAGAAARGDKARRSAAPRASARSSPSASSPS